MLSRKRLTTTLGIGVASIALLGTGVAAFASDQPNPDPAPSCADAINKYNTEQGLSNQAATDREASQRNYDKAKAALADYDAKHGGKDQPPVVKADRDKLVAAMDAASADLAEKQKTYDMQAKDTNDAKANADKACQGPQGPVGANGKDGIDAKVILSPNVCARAVVRPDTQRLVRVIVFIPCPPNAPVPPAVAPNDGDKVIIINDNAPAPQPNTVEKHLPVTH
jgi:hypothetical protein